MTEKWERVEDLLWSWLPPLASVVRGVIQELSVSFELRCENEDMCCFDLIATVRGAGHDAPTILCLVAALEGSVGGALAGLSEEVTAHEGIMFSSSRVKAHAEGDDLVLSCEVGWDQLKEKRAALARRLLDRVRGGGHPASIEQLSRDGFAVVLAGASGDAEARHAQAMWISALLGELIPGARTRVRRRVRDGDLLVHVAFV